MAQHVDVVSVGSLSSDELFENWRYAISQGNIPRGRAIDPVTKWLLIVRACVFPMTLTSGLIGGLLAVATAPEVNWGNFTLACVGIVLAHAANNMINDYFDTEGGVDTEGYTRTLYASHPILSGLISEHALLGVIAAVNAVDFVIMCILAASVGWPVVAFALAGLFISVFYVAPPLVLKPPGLGEPGVAIVWGPLMIAGTYFVTAGTLPSWVWLATIPYALS